MRERKRWGVGGGEREGEGRPQQGDIQSSFPLRPQAPCPISQNRAPGPSTSAMLADKEAPAVSSFTLLSKKGVTAAPARVRFGTRSWRCWFGGQGPHTESLPSCEGERVREGGGERGKGRGGEREAREERRGGRGKPKQDSVKGICTFDFWRVFRLEQRLLDCLLHRIPI